MPCKQFRIGVFFDGTGNNKENDLAGKSANGPSNVAKLSELYKNGDLIKGDELKKMKLLSATVCELHTKMIYIEGVGTRSPKKVWKRGRMTGSQFAPGGFGMVPTYEWAEVDEYQDDYKTGMVAGTEGAERIYTAIDKVREALKGKSADEYNRIIDVFGFSRGAAMARDFINTFKYRSDDIEYNIGFSGLYDTVGSFGLGGDNINLKPVKGSGRSEHFTVPYELAIRYPKQAAVFLGLNPIATKKYLKEISEDFEPYNFHLSAKSAKKITHLVAADEYRINFPLSNIKGAGIDCKMIGVHSDIGGGYPPVSHDRSSFYPSDKKYYIKDVLVSVFTSYDAKGSATTAAQEEQQKLGEGWSCKAVRKSQLLGNGYYKVKCEKVRTITDDLQKVGLVAMYNEAKLGSVPLNDIQYPQVPSDLQTYFSTASVTPTTASSFSPRQPILDNFAHRSSVDTKETHHHRDAGPHDGVGNWDDAKSYLADKVGMAMNYDENDNPMREEYDNKPGLAI